MEAKLTPEERFRLQVQVRKARRLKADDDWRQREAERRADLKAGARYVAMFTQVGQMRCSISQLSPTERSSSPAPQQAQRAKPQAEHPPLAAALSGGKPRGQVPTGQNRVRLDG